MNKFSYLVFISFFSYAITPDKFESLCGGVKYEINSNCKINDLRYDQDKLDIPICEGQILSTQGEKIELSQMTGFVERLNNNGKK
jgi:hypothetical protein